MAIGVCTGVSTCLFYPILHPTFTAPSTNTLVKPHLLHQPCRVQRCPFLCPITCCTPPSNNMDITLLFQGLFLSRSAFGASPSFQQGKTHCPQLQPCPTSSLGKPISNTQPCQNSKGNNCRAFIPVLDWGKCPEGGCVCEVLGEAIPYLGETARVPSP